VTLTACLGVLLRGASTRACITGLIGRAVVLRGITLTLSAVRVLTTLAAGFRGFFGRELMGSSFFMSSAAAFARDIPLLLFIHRTEPTVRGVFVTHCKSLQKLDFVRMIADEIKINQLLCHLSGVPIEAATGGIEFFANPKAKFFDK
jgi:hypothetical protein